MILVTGATGTNGSALVRFLSSRGVPVRALVRNGSKAEGLQSLPNVEVVNGDLGIGATLAKPLRGIDRAMLISSSDAAMLDVQNNFIDAAKAAGVKHIVKLSGIMPEIDSPFRFARMHGLIERHLEASGVAFTNLRSGEFMTAYFRQVPAIVNRGIISMPMDDAKIASMDVDDLAEIAATCLTQSGHEGKTYRLTGPAALTMTEVAAQLSAATGKPITYVNVSSSEYLKGNLARGIPPYLAEALVELYAERRAGGEGTVYPDAATLLGRVPRSFAEFAARNASIFRGEQLAPAV